MSTLTQGMKAWARRTNFERPFQRAGDSFLKGRGRSFFEVGVSRKRGPVVFGGNCALRLGRLGPVSGQEVSEGVPRLFCQGDLGTRRDFSRRFFAREDFRLTFGIDKDREIRYT